MADDGELDVPSMIELTLCQVNAVIDTAWPEDEDDEPDEVQRLFVGFREQLVDILARLKRGHITAEYAEVELEKIEAAFHKWSDENQIPPD